MHNHGGTMNRIEATIIIRVWYDFPKDFFLSEKVPVWNEKHTLFKFKSATIIILQLQKPNTMNAYSYSCTEIGISRSEQIFCIDAQEKNIMVCQSLLKWRTVRFTFMLEYQAKIFPLSRGLMSSRTDIKVQHEQTQNEWNLLKLNSLFCKQSIFYRAIASIPC